MQGIYLQLQSFGRTCPFGGLPGKEEPYGFCSVAANGSLYTVVDPSRSVRTVQLPRVHRLQPAVDVDRVQFRDVGFAPGARQDYAWARTVGRSWLWGLREARFRPGSERRRGDSQEHRAVGGQFVACGTNAVSSSVEVAANRDLRVIMRQLDRGISVRTSRGAPPNGTTLGKVLQIKASQNEQAILVSIQYDKAIWSGLSWAVGEVKSRDLKPGVPVVVRCSSLETRPVELEVRVKAVQYASP